MKGDLVHTKPFILQSDGKFMVIGTKNMERSNLTAFTSCAGRGWGTIRSSRTSAIGHNITQRLPESDVAGDERRHAEADADAEDSTSAEERTAEPAGRDLLGEQTTVVSGGVRLSSESGAVRQPRKGPILMTTGPHQPGQSVERIPGNPSLHRPSDIRPRGAGVSPGTQSVLLFKIGTAGRWDSLARVKKRSGGQHNPPQRPSYVTEPS
jgi:hypothetical protein